MLWTYIAMGLAVMLITVCYLLFRGKGRIKELNSYIDSLKKEITRFSLEVQVASSQVTSVSEHLYVTIDESNALTQRLFAETNEMRLLNGGANEQTHMTIANIRDVINHLDKAADICQNLESMSLNSKEVLGNSLRSILDVVTTIDGIRESSDSIVTYMNKLEHTSHSISSILGSVTNISKQTHLLSLNAAIEAARAGESGLGFAVVADEIRQLANQANEAVEDVNDLISHIQQEVGGVLKVARENNVKVSKGVTLSKGIEENLNKIDKSYGDVLGAVEVIGSLSKQEVEMTQAISTKIEQVETLLFKLDNSVQDVSVSVDKQRQSIEDLTELGSHLNKSSQDLTNLFQSTESTVMNIQTDEASQFIQTSLEMISSRLLNATGLFKMGKDDHKQFVESILKDCDFIEAAWTNDARGKFIVSIPENGIANASVREWFKKAIQGEVFVSKAYASAITRKPCITLSAPIKAPDGEIVGVFGVDLNLQLSNTI